ncbi:MAG: Ig-like domain-containing protein [Saprospiraceae bacterium]|nr:Ig-like domain-containing protein [Saprospiraceae bacterium]
MNAKCLLLAGFFICLWAACANIQGISGGPDDLTPPKWLPAGSSLNQQTEFKDREIKFLFDEWFRLDNPNTHIQIAPSTEYPLIYKIQGKSLLIKFDERENLKNNTTYILQLGAAIKDITKGNVAENMQFVFSTGSFIDSLKITGTVIDAFTGEPQKQTLVCLYLESADSIFKTRKPYYYVITNGSGQFELKHLSPGSFTLYALTDKNNNFYFDQASESVAFHDHTIQLIPNQLQAPISLKMSLQKYALNVKEKNIKSGYTSLVLNRKPIEKVNLYSNSDSVKLFHFQDSIIAWNFSSKPQEFRIQSENFMDTFPVKVQQVINPDSSFKVKLTNVSIVPTDTLILRSEYPICKMLRQHISTDDSTAIIETIQLSEKDPRIIKVSGKWPPGKQFNCILGADIITNCFGQMNAADTLQVFCPPLNSYSSLMLELDSIATPINLTLQLLTNNKLVAERSLLLLTPNTNLIFKYLPSGSYRLRVIHDLNQNGQWDGSDLQNKMQAEPVYYFNLPELRADWEVKAKIKL